MSEYIKPKSFDSDHEAFNRDTLRNREILTGAFMQLQPILWDLTRDVVGEDIWQQFKDGEALWEMNDTQQAQTDKTRETLVELHRGEIDEALKGGATSFLDYCMDKLDKGDSGVDGKVFGAHAKVCQKFAPHIFRNEDDAPMADNVELYESSVEFTLPSGNRYHVEIEYMGSSDATSVVVKRLSIDDSGRKSWISVDESEQNQIIKFVTPKLETLPTIAKTIHRSGGFKSR